MSKVSDRQYWVTSADNYYMVRLHGNQIQQENNYSTSEMCSWSLIGFVHARKGRTWVSANLVHTIQQD